MFFFCTSGGSGRALDYAQVQQILLLIVRHFLLIKSMETPTQTYFLCKSQAQLKIFSSGFGKMIARCSTENERNENKRTKWKNEQNEKANQMEKRTK